MILQSKVIPALIRQKQVMSELVKDSFWIFIIRVKTLVGSFSSKQYLYCMDFLNIIRLTRETKWIVADDAANNKDIPEMKTFSWHLKKSALTCYIAVMYCIDWKLFSYYSGLLRFSDHILPNETDCSQELYSKKSKEAQSLFINIRTSVISLFNRAQLFYEIAHFFRSSGNLFGSNAFREIVTFLQQYTDIYWHNHDIGWNKFICRLDQKISRLPSLFWAQLAALQQQRNFWLDYSPLHEHA